MENIRCDVDENVWLDQQERQDVHQESFLVMDVILQQTVVTFALTV